MFCGISRALQKGERVNTRKGNEKKLNLRTNQTKPEESTMQTFLPVGQKDDLFLRD